MSTPTAAGAVRLDAAEISWLLSLRPGPAALLAAAALGCSPDSAGPPGSLAHRGLSQVRGDRILPDGDAIDIGDTLTAASAFVRVGTAGAIAALIAVGWRRVLVLAPSETGAEVAALDVETSPGAAAAAIAGQIGAGAVVMVAQPAGRLTTVAPPRGPGPTLAEAVDAAVAAAGGPS